MLLLYCGCLQLKAAKPQWSSGASFVLKRKSSTGSSSTRHLSTRHVSTRQHVSAPPRPPGSWQGVDDEELVEEEDALLTGRGIWSLPTLPPEGGPGARADEAPRARRARTAAAGGREMEEKAGKRRRRGGGEAHTGPSGEPPVRLQGAVGLGTPSGCAGCP